MERSESAGLNPNVDGEQTSFQNSGAERFSASGAESGAGTTESDSGIKGRVRNVASTVKDKAAWGTFTFRGAPYRFSVARQ